MWLLPGCLPLFGDLYSAGGHVRIPELSLCRSHGMNRPEMCLQHVLGHLRVPLPKGRGISEVYMFCNQGACAHPARPNCFTNAKKECPETLGKIAHFTSHMRTRVVGL